MFLYKFSYFLFQSTLPRRERLKNSSSVHGASSFQSTLPRRERPKTLPLYTAQVHFNPRSREGSDRQTRNATRQMVLFQSTLPRRERRNMVRQLRARSAISIHAPAKGATATRDPADRNGAISIHAPAKGATKRGRK